MWPSLFLAASLLVPEESLTKAFHGRDGALVLIDCATGETQRHNPPLCAAKFAPCSTFKIWNTAIGLETGLLTSADQPFYKWDGVKRAVEGWNQDLTLRQAYAVSCVPAYQDLARRIGPERMNGWLKKLNYGNKDTSAGHDVFWLPAPGRKPLLISANEQALLLRRLVNGEVPFSAKTHAILQDVMMVKATDRGTLYGKTGSSGDQEEMPAIGWFVGYATSGKKTLAFACLLYGKGILGKDARAVVEQLFSSEGLL